MVEWLKQDVLFVRMIVMIMWVVRISCMAWKNNESGDAMLCEDTTYGMLEEC